MFCAPLMVTFTAKVEFTGCDTCGGSKLRIAGPVVPTEGVGCGGGAAETVVDGPAVGVCGGRAAAPGGGPAGCCGWCGPPVPLPFAGAVPGPRRSEIAPAVP